MSYAIQDAEEHQKNSWVMFPCIFQVEPGRIGLKTTEKQGSAPQIYCLPNNNYKSVDKQGDKNYQ